MLRIQYLDQSQRPIHDELVVTSGEGGLVPFGIRVGQVKILKEAEEYMIKPNADFGNINLVSVIIDNSES
jgi:cell shape-determining protein MreC